MILDFIVDSLGVCIAKLVEGDILENLKIEVQKLISRKTEGEYWDFKREWHKNNSDLLHDIICMANSTQNRDCYIIIGVEDKTGSIVGVVEENRKNQQNVINLLRQKPKWAGGYCPEVLVYTFVLEDFEVDVIVIKQTNNTPFYLLEEYKQGKGKPLYKGAIYTRRGDTNTPRNETADVYEVELLWKRRFGLLQNPSQRGLFYLKDIENWIIVEIDGDKSGRKAGFYYYSQDPDYTIHFENVVNESEYNDNDSIREINDDRLGPSYAYLYSFINVSYHKHFYDNEKVILYYKDIPLFSSQLEIIDEGRTTVVPPEFSNRAYYIKNSFRHLMYELMFSLRGLSHSYEAKEMFERVIPVYTNENELHQFQEYITSKGYSDFEVVFGSMKEEALERLNLSKIDRIDIDNIIPNEIESLAKFVLENKNCVFNFASMKSQNYDLITQKLQKGKMLVDWLAEWRTEESSSQLVL